MATDHGGRARSIVVLGSRRDGWHVNDLARAARDRDVPLLSLGFESIHARVGSGTETHPDILAASPSGERISLAEAASVLVRSMPAGTLEQVVFRMDALQRLEAAGVPVVNPPRAVEAAVDKYLALAKVEAAGVPVPSTWVGESVEAALDAFEALGGDVVIKPLFGSEGRGLVRVDHREVAWRVLNALARSGSILYLQQFIPTEEGDVRVFLLAGMAIAAVRRFAAGIDWRTNAAQGGRAVPWDPEPGAIEFARGAASALGAEVAGVDLVWDRAARRWLVLEVNAAPGWRALSRTIGTDVAGRLVEHLIRRAEANR